MPYSGNQPQTAQPPEDSGLVESHGPRWGSSLWFWPLLAIGIASIAGAFFGSFGVILSAEAFAGLGVVAGILFVSRDRWLTFCLAAALIASFAAIAASILLHESRGTGDGNASHIRPSKPGAANQPVDWQWQVISQTMASGADFRGADLDNANLNGLQLSHVNLDGLQADGASLRGTQLEYASLRGASLRGACLAGANLTGADLTGADFTGADVVGIQVSSQATRMTLAWPGTSSGSLNACR